MSKVNDTTIASGDREDTSSAPLMPQAMSRAHTSVMNEDPGDVGAMMNALDPILYKKQIAFARTTWSTKDAAGKELFRFRVDPSEGNWAIKYFTTPYITWSGSMVYQFRIGGTGFNGGKLIVVYIPPNLNPDDYDINDITTFDHELMDPKTLDGKEIIASDSKTVLAHWNQRMDDTLFGKVVSFGGTVIVSSFIELVSSSEQNSELTVVAFNKLGADFRVSGLKPPSISNDFTRNYPVRAKDFCSHPVFAFRMRYAVVGDNLMKANEAWNSPLSGADPPPAIVGLQTVQKLDATPQTSFQSETNFPHNLADKDSYRCDLRMANAAGGLKYTVAEVTEETDKSLTYTRRYGGIYYARADPLTYPNSYQAPLGERIVSFGTDKGDLYGPLSFYEFNVNKVAGFYSEAAGVESDLILQWYDTELKIPTAYFRLNHAGYISTNIAKGTTYDLSNGYWRNLGYIAHSERLPKDPAVATSQAMMLRTEAALERMGQLDAPEQSHVNHDQLRRNLALLTTGTIPNPPGTLEYTDS